MGLTLSRVTKRTKFSYKISFLFIFALLLQTGVSSAQTAESSSATETQAEQNTTDKKDSEDSKKKKSEEDTKKTTESQETKEENSASTTEANSESVNSSQPTVESSTPAATAPKASAGAQDSDALIEEENVTSSRLKKMDISGASPELTFSGGDISKAGYNSVSDLLRDSPISSTGATREASGSTGAGTATVDLRGLGADNTLVLINGMRMSPVSGADYANINLIPQNMIKDIKVIKDDLSSIYGSDAIGGVLNIITHDSYSGITVEAGATATKLGGGENYDFNVLGGYSTAKTNVVYSLGFRRNQMIYARDRKWSDFNPSTVGSPGSYISVNDPNKIWYPDPLCPPDQIMPIGGGSSVCAINAADYATSLPQLQQASAFTRVEHEILPNVSLYAEALYSRLDTYYVYAPTPGTLAVPADVAQHYLHNGAPLPGYVPGSDLIIRYRTLEYGNRNTSQTENYYNFTTGIKWDFLDTWSGKLATTYGFQEKTDKTQGNAIKPLLQDLISQPVPGGMPNEYMFMPFNPAGSRGDISSAYFEPWARNKANFFMADLQLQGEAFEILNRPVFLTVGQSYVFRDYENVVDPYSATPDPDGVYSGAGSNGAAQRYFHSTYAQLEANLTSRLDLYLAGRYDIYNDFGDTFNPKLGMKYRITDNLMFRTTVGTGFKAPALSDLYASRSNGFRSFIDHYACQRYGSSDISCGPRQYQVTSEGNKDLSEITSFSYNTGLLYSPTTNLNISLDFWSVAQKGLAWSEGDTTLEDVTRAEAAGIDVSALGIEMNRDPVTGRLDETKSIFAPTLAISERKSAGLDLELSYSIPMPLGQIMISEMASYRLWDVMTVLPGVPDRDYVKEHWINRWRNTLNISYLLSGHRIGMTVVSTDKFMNAVKDGFIDRYHRFDLNYAYTGFKNLELSAGVQNFLGTTPPQDSTDPINPMDTSLFSERGPFVFSNVKYTF